MTQELKVLAGIGILTIAILIGGVLLVQKSAPPASNTPVDTTQLVTADSYKIGSDSAKVKIVEFGDFQCPACASAEGLVKSVIESNKDSVQFIFRHFPLPGHKNARIAAQAAEAAGDQGKFWEMKEKLFNNQSEWAESNNPMEFYEKYAQELGLDVEKFKEAVNSRKFIDKIEKDVTAGISLGVNSTPTFYLNNRKLDNYGQMQQMVEEELKR